MNEGSEKQDRYRNFQTLKFIYIRGGQDLFNLTFEKKWALSVVRMKKEAF